MNEVLGNEALGSEVPGLTPSQTVGPYFSIGMLRTSVGSRLVEAADPRAIALSGLLLDGEGRPVHDGMVEVWQANTAGRYAHPRDTRDELPLDDGFSGFARSGTTDGGRFLLTIVRPGRVPWPHGGLQAPHLEVGVFARGLLKRVVTRIYFPDETTANEADPVLARLDQRSRESLIAEATAGGLHFDIVLQGPDQTTFFAI
jgi:protocatechuate 3,4-dioxygenase alpha subunit